MTVEKLSTKAILNRNLSRTAPEGMRRLKLVLHDVRSMHNVGAAFRNADAFGIEEIILSGFSPSPPRPEITKTALGAEEHVPWRRTEDLPAELQRLSERGYRIAGLEQTSGSRLLPDYEIRPEASLCLVMGNEVTGLDESLLPHMDDFLEIPQYGHKHSLNVSVAAGVALYALLQKYWDA